MYLRQKVETAHCSLLTAFIYCWCATSQSIGSSATNITFYTLYIYRQVTPTVRPSGGSVMLWGAFCWQGLCPRVPLEGRLTANQYKAVLTDHLYPVMKHFYPDGSGLSPQGRRDHWMVWWVWKRCESYAVAFTVTRSQPGWTPMRDFGPTC